MTQHQVVTGTGTDYQPPTRQVLDKRLHRADRPGQHLWLMTAAWALDDPERSIREAQYLDAENLLVIAGPGCYKCEREYSRKLARQPCRGSVEQLQ